MAQPMDSRESILDTLKRLQILQRARAYLFCARSSRLIEELHSAFHAVARRRVQTRFGFLTDSPRQIVHARDAHDAEVAS